MKTFIVDSFTQQPFKGNPAGVCFVQEALPEERMQYIATELGLSETAFVQSTGKEGVYSIRYFSPKQEIPLCGHATLASAKVIFRDSDKQDIHFITVQQLDLKVKRNGKEISMEFPLYQTRPAAVSAAVLAALGLSKIENVVFSQEHNIIMLEIDDAGILKTLQPDFSALVQSYNGINGILVTAPSNDNEYDYHYRYFWPWVGTNEDPVTGGVQTFLSKYWSDKLQKKTMKAFQSSARTGYMQVDVQPDKVVLTSQAVIVLEGQLEAFH